VRRFMLARLQNQLKNSADIGAACAACSVMTGRRRH
jgi:hypothetical protein